MLDALGIYGGLVAGLLTSLLWTATTLWFTAASRRIGPTAVNSYRIALAILLLGVTHCLVTGTIFPPTTVRQLGLLALSGVVGLSLGDQALFMSFVYIGPRLASLIMTTSPIMAALFGWLVLGEVLGGAAWFGIAMTVVGVAWVVLERPDTPTSKVAKDIPGRIRWDAEPPIAPQESGEFGCVRTRPSRRLRGVVLALLAAVGQSGGYLLSKQGIGHGWLPADQMMEPLGATYIRMIFAGVGMAPILAWRYARQRGQLPTGLPSDRFVSRRAGLLMTAGGAFAGSFLGVWMSLEACDRAPLGIAQTLCSLTPVFLLPVVVVLQGERVSPRAVIGAIVAVAGSALLFLTP